MGEQKMALSPPMWALLNKMCEGSSWSMRLFASNKSPVSHSTDPPVTSTPAPSTTNTICLLPAPGGCCVLESPPRLVSRASISALHSNLWATARKSCLGNALELHRLAWPEGLVPRSSQHHNLVGVSASAVSHWTRKKQLFLSEQQYFQPSTKQLFRDVTSWDQTRCD